MLVSQNGTVNSRNYFYPFGGNRGGAAFSALTTKRFTGQYHEQGLPGGEGLSYYGARWYDAQLGRFTSPDTIAPGAGNPQALNRYSYVFNNPLGFTDPSGHDPIGCDSCNDRWDHTHGKTVTTKDIAYVNQRYAQGNHYIETNYYGFKIDVQHFNSAYRKASGVILPGLDEGATIQLENVPFNQYSLKVSFNMTYKVLKPIPANMRANVGLGIYLDFEQHSEEWQGVTYFGFQRWAKGSYHSIEDTPSNYLGYVAAVNHLPLSQIVNILGGGRPTNEEPPKVKWGGCLLSDCSVRNYSYTPRVYVDRSYQNIPWPTALQITPASNDGYWRGSDYYLETLKRFLPPPRDD